MSTLPKELQEAQEKIAAWHKEDQLKQLIGKYYCAWRGSGYPTALRRIYMDKQNLIRVDEYEMIYAGPNQTFSEFKFSTYTINESLPSYGDQTNWCESEGKVWHESLIRLLNIDALKTGAFLELQADRDKEWKRMCDYKILSEQQAKILDEIKELTKCESSPDYDKFIAKKLYEMFEVKPND